MRSLRIWVGLAFWIALLWVLVGAFQYRFPSSDLTHGDGLPSKLWQYWIGARSTLELRLPTAVDVAVGDPVFTSDPWGILRQVGEIRTLSEHGAIVPARCASVAEAQALLFPTAPVLDEETQVIYFTTPASVHWIVQTLL